MYLHVCSISSVCPSTVLVFGSAGCTCNRVFACVFHSLYVHFYCPSVRQRWLHVFVYSCVCVFQKLCVLSTVLVFGSACWTCNRVFACVFYSLYVHFYCPSVRQRWLHLVVYSCVCVFHSLYVLSTVLVFSSAGCTCTVIVYSCVCYIGSVCFLLS